MNALSIFVDESGDFGDYKHHSPYYIISMVFHNQNNNIKNEIDITFKCFHIEKKHISNSLEASFKLSKQLSSFFLENYNKFLSYEKIIIYYDNGQIELTRILSSVLTSLFPQVDFRKAN